MEPTKEPIAPGSAGPPEEGLTFLQLAEVVLAKTRRPMTYREIWDYAVAEKLASRLGSKGATPWQTMSAQLSQDVKRAGSKFANVGIYPTRYYLKSLGEPDVSVLPTALEEREESEEANHEKERDLHPLVAYFAHEKLGAPVKTIYQEKSKKRGYLKWVHPDLVGFVYAGGGGAAGVVHLESLLGRAPIELLSFEVKLRLGFGTLGPSFFEAVGNSSWANRGYLAAADIDDDTEFNRELRRLSNRHGIGVIHLDRDIPENSSVYIEARRRDSVDWATVNILYETNPDFEEFVDAVRSVAATGKTHAKDYDPVQSAGQLRAYSGRSERRRE
jgi:hypothetical protein